VHGFCSRRGGVSCGAFATLNLSFHVGDEEQAVRENWRRLRQAVAGRVQFETVSQVHGCRIVEAPPAGNDPGEADGLVTQAVGTAVGVLTADCVPMLLVAPEQRVVAAVHAGWRGTVAGIAAHVVRHLRGRFGADPATVLAALGPAIGTCCYEVDAAIGRKLEDQWPAMPADVCRKRPGKPGKIMLDLRRANRQILLHNGMGADNIRLIGPCTRCAVGEYFSYRAAQGGPGPALAGRQLSFIGWREV
jgi:YfiH family protein